MYRVRQLAVKHSRKFEALYNTFEPMLIKLHPLFRRLGYGRIEKPVRVVEKAIKGFLFDCQMCGKCALGDTGMSCPMNCPKSIRNGPCGGVRENGTCEIKPDMRCVWVDAWRGSRQMRDQNAIHQVQLPVNHLLKGSSSWLREVRSNVTVPGSENSG